MSEEWVQKKNTLSIIFEDASTNRFLVDSLLEGCQLAIDKVRDVRPFKQAFDIILAGSRWHFEDSCFYKPINGRGPRLHPIRPLLGLDKRLSQICQLLGNPAKSFTDAYLRFSSTEAGCDELLAQFFFGIIQTFPDPINLACARQPDPSWVADRKFHYV
jgi:hypothetical protein